VLWAAPETKLGIFVWLFVIVVVALRARGGITRHLVRINAALLVFMVGCSFFAWGLLNWSLNWVHFSGCLFLVAWSLGRCSQRHWHEVVAWGCMLALTIPLPFVYRDLDGWISSVAAQFASATLDSFGVPHFLDNLQLTLQAGKFTTSTATSPQLGLYAIICSTAVWCWLWGRSLSATLVMILSASISLLMMRYVAVLTVSYGLLHYNSDWTARGQVHYIISAGSFVVCMLLAILFDRLVEALFRPIPVGNPEYMTVFATANAIMSWPKSLAPNDAGNQEEFEELRAFKRQLEQWRLSWYVMDWNRKRLFKLAVFGCSAICGLGIIPVVLVVARNGLIQRPLASPVLQLEDIGKVVTAELLPAEAGGFRLAKFEIFGQSSQNDMPIKLGPLSAQWTYLWEGYSVTVDLQAPTITWQAPLKSDNSNAIKTSVALVKGSAKDGWAWLDCRLTNALGGDAYLMQCCLADDLTAAKYEQQVVTTDWPVISKLSGKSAPLDVMYDIQVFCESGNPLSIERLKELQAFFEMTRRTLQSKLPADQLQQWLAPQG
jgi:hypothetical protein